MMIIIICLSVVITVRRGEEMLCEAEYALRYAAALRIPFCIHSSLCIRSFVLSIL